MDVPVSTQSGPSPVADPASGVVDVEVGHSTTLASESASNSELSVEKQLELEANDAIKYRTCSWPKVRDRPSSPRVQRLVARVPIGLRSESHRLDLFSSHLDGGSTLLRVHLSGYNVVPLVIFRLGTGSRNLVDPGRGGLGPVHLFGPLVCHPSTSPPPKSE